MSVSLASLLTSWRPVRDLYRPPTRLQIQTATQTAIRTRTQVALQDLPRLTIRGLGGSLGVLNGSVATAARAGAGALEAGGRSRGYYPAADALSLLHCCMNLGLLVHVGYV